MARKKVETEASAEVTLLRGIWEEIKALNQRIDHVRIDLAGRIDQTNAQLGQTNARLDLVRDELKSDNQDLRRRLTESEVRVGTALTELSSDIRDLHGLIREWREEHRADRAELRGRVDRLERHAGLHG